MEEIASFGAWIRRRRRALDLTQEALAQRVGCAPGTIRKIEADERRPSRQLAELLAEQLVIPPAERVAFLKAARAELAVERLAAPTPPADQAAARLASLPLPSGTVTFLFSDIEGSTRLWEQHASAMPEALARHDAILREAIATHGGVVFRTVGDAFCAAFARATDALAAALAAQRALHMERWGPTGPLLVRMALHTGVVEVGGSDYLGLPLSRVARLLAAGHGGQVLLSRATQELVREQLPAEATLRDLGEHRLKDLTYPEQIFQLIAADLPADFPPLRTLATQPTNLPAQPTALIGREAEVRTVAELLRRTEVRLVTLTGPGGVGKTRLALQVAAELLDDFRDGVYFVNLAPLSDPELVVSTIAQTLGVKEAGSQPLVEQLTSYLREKHMLLLLDNFEQVAAAAPLLSELLASAARLKLLVTSRAVLHLYGEYEFIVPALSLPPLSRARETSEAQRAGWPAGEGLTQYAAVRLFIERALMVKPDFAVTNETAPAVAEICHRLDGLPLAIELAAAPSKLFAPQALLKRLEHRLSVLTTGARDLPPRQQTLRNAIEWSYQLLDAAEQTLFRRLAVFVGGCTLEAAEAVCGAGERENGRTGEQESNSSALLPFSPSPLLDLLAALVDKSLLRQTEGVAGEPRFTMLETIREYAIERLNESGEAEQVRRQHAAYYLALAEQAEPALRGPEQVAWLERLATEHDNLRGALAWSQTVAGQVETALRLAGALWPFWFLRGYLSEAQDWLAGLPMRSELAERCVAQAKVLFGRGTFAKLQGNYAQATACYEASLALFRESGDTRGMARAIGALGVVAYDQAEYGRARALYEESLALFRQLGDKHGIANSLLGLGSVAYDQAEYGRARALQEENLALFRELEDKHSIANSLIELTLAAMAQGDLTRARVWQEESLELFRELGEKDSIGTSLNNLGGVAYYQGDYERAHALYEESGALWRELGDRSGIPISLKNLGLVALAQGDLVRAHTCLLESLALFQEQRNLRRIAECLEGLAGVAAAQGQLERAAHLAGAAEALREAIGAPLPPVARPAYDRNLAAVRAQLSDASIAAAWAEGRAMPLEQAVAEALGAEAQSV